jgi:hypothetical protein
MRVTKEFGAYNHRRYTKPWIARVAAWAIGKPPELVFGGLVGLTAEIEASPGDLVRWGQRDTRGNGTESNWGIVGDDGAIEQVTPEKARAHWLNREATRVA